MPPAAADTVVFATANICTARPGEAKGDVGLNVTGRMHELDRQFGEAGFQVIAVQEGRLPQSQQLRTERDDIFVAPRLGKDLGTQLWIERDLRKAWRPEVQAVDEAIVCEDLQHGGFHIFLNMTALTEVTGLTYEGNEVFFEV